MLALTLSSLLAGAARAQEADVRAAIKEAYRLIFRSESDLKLSVAAIRETLPDLPEIATILKFVEASERGLI